MEKIDFKKQLIPQDKLLSHANSTAKLTEDELHKEVYELLEKIEVLKTENKKLTEKNEYLIDTLLDLEEKMDCSDSDDSDNINIDEPPNVSASCVLEEKKN